MVEYYSICFALTRPFATIGGAEYDLENDFVAEIQNEFGQEQCYEEEEKGHEPSQALGKCVSCNFVSNSGVLVCSTCGHIFDPDAHHERKEHAKVTKKLLRISCPRSSAARTATRSTCTAVARSGSAGCILKWMKSYKHGSRDNALRAISSETELNA